MNTSTGRSLKLLNALTVLLMLAFGLNSTLGQTMTRCIEEERRALVSFGSSLFHKQLPTPWPNGEECCQWKGVQCSNETSHVVGLRMPGEVIPGIGYEQSTMNPSLIELQQLEHLDLSSRSLTEIPHFLGSLSNLRYLNLSSTNVSGTVPVELGKLWHLLSGNSYTNAETLEWLSNLTSLEYLDLSMMNLSRVHDWLHVMNRLPKLRILRLGGCDLPAPIFSSPLSKSDSTLEEIVLHGNRLTSSIVQWLFNHGRTLFYLDLSNNHLDGLIPEAFGSMNFLEFVDLSHNLLEGGIPNSFGSLCSLRVLNLIGNRISGQLETLIEMLSKCTQNGLESPSSNEKMKPLSNVTKFSLLKVLDLSNNYLNGTIPEIIGNLSELETLNMSGNSLKGVITEAHFSKLSKLKYLDLSSNTILLNFHTDWTPPFQLDTIRLNSLNLGSSPGFPAWIRTQNDYSELDISNASISGTIPTWLWDGLSSKSCRINLSHNQLSGKLQNLSVAMTSFPGVDLSFNQLEGPIPSFLWEVTSLDLSNNAFSGPISSLCTRRNLANTLLDLSNNQLSGELPDCWTTFQSLLVLDLANNNFYGKLPTSMGFLYIIRALQLRHNNFSGELPASLKECSKLEVLDLGGNEFSGLIPEWIGDSFPDLKVISLRMNNFSGTIPSQLCHLQRTHIVDLSGNTISGGIPKCLNNLTALTKRDENSNATIRVPYTSGLGSSGSYGSVFYTESSLNWQGKVYEYKSEMNLGYVKCIDLSNNALSGEIPAEITHLVGLVSLNLSWNGLMGHIPSDIGDMEELNALDVSRNRLSGEIPTSLTKIDRLANLNLSNNNLSGRIPTGTQLLGFDAATYAGNPELCGLPLEDCHEEETNPQHGNDEEEDGFITRGFYISMALGFVVGIWGVLVTLMLNKSWRFKYFEFFSAVYDWL
ncbi:LRR domain containing protein [Trema orientale]|uniref:LRR domain containing protein n=1 Tax=Trema orientale TaxID=63057 RepID=A0A2P5AJ94_TREOI|nr:LRR domain containing protein [Trema orientale]